MIKPGDVVLADFVGAPILPCCFPPRSSRLDGYPTATGKASKYAWQTPLALPFFR